MKYGHFSSVKDAVNRFVSDELSTEVLSPDPPTKLSLSERFASFLSRFEFTQLRAEEEAEKQGSLLRHKVSEALEQQWAGLGIPAPI